MSTIRTEIDSIVQRIGNVFNVPRTAQQGADKHYGHDYVSMSIRLDDWNEEEFARHVTSLVQLMRRYKELRRQEARDDFEDQKRLLIQREISGGIPRF